jgi:hypothetical protein
MGVLLPHWISPPPKDEVVFKIYDNPQGVLEVPAPWQPIIPDTVDDLEKVEAFAYPTPWAWAYMTAAVIREQKWNHLLFQRYAILLKALTLGELRLEIVDLQSSDFGKLLCQVDDRFRYLGLVRGRLPEKEGQEEVIWGATSPETLVWPAPRRKAPEWQSLYDRVRSRETDALRLWADVRALLQDRRQWDPRSVPWMAAVDHLVGGLSGSEGQAFYHIHCRTVGPVAALFPDGQMNPFYLPTYAPDFAKEFLRALTGTFHPEGETVVIRDSRSQPAYGVVLPSIAVGGDFRRAGGGVVQVLAGRVRPYFEDKRIRLRDDSRGMGYFSALKILYDELAGPERDLADAVRRYPYLYPDAVRIIIHRLGEAGVPDSAVVFSERAYEVLFERDIAGLPRLQDLQTPSADAFVYKTQEVTAVFLENYQGAWFGDLRALGWVLWQYFNGEADFERGSIRDGRSAEPLMEGLYAVAAAYEKVRTDDERRRCRRLATLQRFVRAYQDGEGSRPEEALCRRAAEVFARWVWGEDVRPNGPRGRETKVPIGPGTFRLFRDEL